MNKRRLAAVIGMALSAVLAVAIPLAARAVRANETAPVPRPESWSQHVEMEGVPNLYKVSDNLYRSAQPSAKGMANLEEMGIKTVVNLRLLNSDRDEMEGAGMGYVHIPMEAWDADEDEVMEFLDIASDPERVPVLVHCNLGSDRTGTMCAAYRVTVQGWSKEEAIAEMTRGGFGFNEVWANLPLWLWTADTDEMKTRADAGHGEREKCLGGSLLAVVSSARRVRSCVCDLPIVCSVLPVSAAPEFGLRVEVVSWVSRLGDQRSVLM